MENFFLLSYEKGKRRVDWMREVKEGKEGTTYLARTFI
jgi:hypothetical protein